MPKVIEFRHRGFTYTEVSPCKFEMRVGIRTYRSGTHELMQATIDEFCEDPKELKACYPEEILS